MTRVCAAALIFAVASIAAPVSAQDVFGGGQSFYIDGRQPVDQRTRDLVDSYMAHKELLEQEEAERREKFELFIFNDLQSTGAPYGRF